VFVERNWQQDKRMLESGIRNLKTYPRPWWFIIFPEGTRFSAVKRDANQQVRPTRGLGGSSSFLRGLGSTP
jgi:1-acyl-sn-glycerol-3-phosphate acyltransferase